MRSRRRRVLGLVGLVALAALAAAAGWAGRDESAPSSRRATASPAPAQRQPHDAGTRTLAIHYEAHNGVRRDAYVVLPRWYGPRNHPPIPLIISPHGRGLSGRQNSRLWGDLPARGPFAVVSPDGHGRLLDRYSWGFAGQVDDLARMPDLVRRELPWLRIDRSRIYAFGGSMGGQESLLLVARHPRLLAGAAVFDAVTDFAHQYRRFPLLSCDGACLEAWAEPLGIGLQKLARREVGGTPDDVPDAYAARSPLTYARELAASCVPLQFWWSVADRVVTDQQRQSARLFWTLRRINRAAPVQAFAGFWIHSAEMHARARLPLALATFGLVPHSRETRKPRRLRVVPPPRAAVSCVARR